MPGLIFQAINKLKLCSKESKKKESHEAFIEIHVYV